MSASATETTHTPRTRAGVRLRLVGLFHAPAPRRPSRAQRARATLGWFVVGVLLLNAAALAALDSPWPNLRDPEYGLRVTRLRARVAEHPDRTPVLVFGSSRVCMGVKPAAWEAARSGTSDDPLLFNFGTIGAGPVQELVAVRRVYADGFRPAVVLLEYWPPALRQDGRHSEQHRVGRRLRLDDRPVVHDYFPDPDRVERDMLAARLSPLTANRDRWLVRARPMWFPARQRADNAWRDLDRWGWLPGLDVQPDDAAARRRFLAHHREYYRDQFDGHAIHPNSDRALGEAVSLARAHGARVGLLFMPESSEFQGWYPPDVERAAREHFVALARQLDVPAIDARDWMSDDQLADGFHLSRTGAGAFTARLGPAVGAAFPRNRERP